MAKLREKQQRFVQEYLKDLDPAAAYRRAGYKPASDKAARNAASRLLANVGVAAAVKEGQQDRGRRVQLTQDMVVEGLHTEATDRGEDASHAARVAAWKLLGQHLGMFADRVEHTGADGGPIVIREIVVDGQGERQPG